MGPPNQCKCLRLFPPEGIRFTENKDFFQLAKLRVQERVSSTKMAKIQILFINVEIHTFDGMQKGCLQRVVLELNAKILHEYGKIIMLQTVRYTWDFWSSTEVSTKKYMQRASSYNERLTLGARVNFRLLWGTLTASVLRFFSILEVVKDSHQNIFFKCLLLKDLSPLFWLDHPVTLHT